jgi:hypothetical protein
MSSQPNCDEPEHKHLGDKQIMAVVEALMKTLNEKIRSVQKHMLDTGLCEGDFYTLVINLATMQAANAVGYLCNATSLSKKEVLAMFMQGFLKKLDVEYVQMNIDEVPEKEAMH